MARKRILLKLSHPTGIERIAPQHLGLAGDELALEPLFTVPAPVTTDLRVAAEPSRRHAWYAADVASGRAFGAVEDRSEWDVAHRVLQQGLGAAGDVTVLAAEPDLEQQWVTAPPPDKAPPALMLAPRAPCEPEPIESELPHGARFAWHLEPRFSELAAARNAAMGSGSDVTIVHLDTGYDPDHKALPEKLDRRRQRNFVAGEPPNDASDRTPAQGLLRNRGHGTGTIGILAGGKLSGMRPPQANSNDYLGGAPLATIVPVRVANSVALFRTSSIAQGIDYAREIGADVVSMSMGGLPSNAWADAVNAAYEAGVVIVCAAGNNYDGWPTSSIVWPAQFQRVLAACGIMADGRPYFNLPPWIMQGCYGPLSKMATAMAAFTPNIPWPKLGCREAIDLDGNGTSAATPQIAAAAALWLRKHKQEIATKRYAQPWMKVEAVRRALFRSAGGHAATPHEFFGQGIVHANHALGIRPADAAQLKKTPADHAPFAFLQSLAGLALDVDPRRLELYRLEMTQLATQSRRAFEAVPDPGVAPAQVPERARREFLEAILDERKGSRALRRYLEAQLGRRPTVVAPERPAPAGAREAAAVEGKAPPVRPRTYQPTRRRPPARRRLQIFAVDPGASNRLETAFLNKTIVDVPWEGDASGTGTLEPGPVGEYLEVVDVDPPSGKAYPPVDLNDPYLLAECGLSPSEGNPQFHQQQVYAVAMRTIEAFESATGRRALWAAKIFEQEVQNPATGKTEKVCQEVYVPRLRIYPHALRQANAYYSPDKIALLFGYFPEVRPGGPGDEDDALGAMVFTCLSQDIVAHETTHALLDGLHRSYQEASNVDVLAFHEAFADIVAIFQHFTLKDLLRFEIARTRGDLRTGQFMTDLAQQFGTALGRSKALRSAIGVDPAVINYATTSEPHERGSILVAAVFDAFLKIYQRRIEDLLRIATGGSGILRPGALHPDLVERLAHEASKSARHVLEICIRGLDYCPPLDITFADYLRALITADADLVGVDKYGYRVAFLEAFGARHIYPQDVRTLSVESLRWGTPAAQPPKLGEFLREMRFDWKRQGDRRQAYAAGKQNAAMLHKWLADPERLTAGLAVHLGLNRSDETDAKHGEFRLDRHGRPRFTVHSVRPAYRVAPDADIKTDVVVVITQSRLVPLDEDDPEGPKFPFRGGCALIIDPDNDDEPIRYSVVKNVMSSHRLESQRQFLDTTAGLSLRSLYFGFDSRVERKEPFALLHIGQ